MINNPNRQNQTETVLQARLHLMQYANTASLDELLQETLDTVCGLTDSPIGFYHFLEADQITISLQAWSTETEQKFCKAEGKGLHYNIDEAGVWVDCIHQRRAVIHNDYATLPGRKGLPPGHAELVRELVAPVFRKGSIVAILGVGNKSNLYTEYDVELVTIFADLAWDVAERKKNEEALRENSEQMETMINTSLDGFLIISKDGRILDGNAEYCRMSRYSLSELMNITIMDLEAVENQEEIQKHTFKTIQAGSDRFETRHKRKDGTMLDVEVSTTFFPSGGYFLSFFRDITERKRVTSALEKRVAALTRPVEINGKILFEELFNLEDIQRLQDEFSFATGVASIITQTDGTPITRPSNFCRLCNDIIRKTEKGLINCYRSDAAIGKLQINAPTVQPCMSGGLWDAGAGIMVDGHHIANWLIGQVRDKTQNEAQMLAYAREIGANETEFLEAFREVPSMSQETFEQIARFLFTLANQLSAIAFQNVQQARFISERNQAEDALRISERRFQQMFARHQAMMLLISPYTGDILDANPAASYFYGYSIKELCKMQIQQINLLPDDQVIEAMRAAMQGERSYSIFQHKLASGEIRTVEVHSSPIEFEKENLLFSIVHDISERIDAESRLKEQLTELRRWYDVTLGRENRILELKKEVNDLLLKAGEQAKYTSPQQTGRPHA